SVSAGRRGKAKLPALASIDRGNVQRMSWWKNGYRFDRARSRNPACKDSSQSFAPEEIARIGGEDMERARVPDIIRDTRNTEPGPQQSDCLRGRTRLTC